MHVPAITEAVIPYKDAAPASTGIGDVFLFAGYTPSLPVPLLEKTAAWFVHRGCDLFRHADPANPGLASPWQARWRAENYAQEIVSPRSFLVVAVLPVWRGLVVGLGRLTLPTGRGTAASLHDLVIDPDARRAGLGRLLTVERIRICQAAGAKRVITHIFEGNAASQQLHCAVGFQPGTHPVVDSVQSASGWWHLDLPQERA